jgi:rfaE bifunctional protein kinase chain/domain
MKPAVALHFPQLADFARKHVLVIGDLMLDEFARGDVRRISPEAPVPVLEVHARDHRLGGAANTAANIAALGARTTVVGLLGDDAGADRFEALCRERSVGHRAVRDASRPTTQKTRLVARGQQIVRIDQEARSRPGREVCDRLRALVEEAGADADAFIISDYAKGVVTPEICATIVGLAERRRLPIVTDPKSRDLRVYRRSTVITPNHGEIELAVGRPLETTEEIVEAMQMLLPTLEGSAILVTRGGAGMSLLEPGGEVVHCKATAKSVFDVTGAGDTVVATLGLALASGIPLRHAIVVASAAAGVVVSREGTATLTQADLSAALGEMLG